MPRNLATCSYGASLCKIEEVFRLKRRLGFAKKVQVLSGVHLQKPAEFSFEEIFCQMCSPHCQKSFHHINPK
jgi:hypothetical protein